MQSAQQSFEFWDRRTLQLAEDVVEANRLGYFDLAKRWRLCRDNAMENVNYWYEKMQ
jgi:hypothetical protein